MTKSDHIVELLRRRLDRGDYMGRQLPPENTLAREVGVSRMTARKALLRLEDSGHVIRQPNGRMVPRPAKSDAKAGPQLLILRRAQQSGFGSTLDGIMSAVDDMNGSARTVDFVHWDDRAIFERLPLDLDEIDATVDGVFVVPPAEKIPPHALERLQNTPMRVVVVGSDLSAHGVRSFVAHPPSIVQPVLDHLASKGHQRIDCFNTQPEDDAISARIQQWTLWRSANNIDGQLVNDPVLSYEDVMRRAMVVGREYIRRPDRASAVLCLTSPAAVSLMRAAHDAGLVIGEDIAIAAANDEGLSRYLIPTLTSVSEVDPVPYARMCIEWMMNPAISWHGPLLLRPDHFSLFVGESTNPKSSH